MGSAWLERFFQEQLASTGDYNVFGNYWEAGNKNEIDNIALSELDKTVLIAEVKRNPKQINLNHLREKPERV